jgi:competence protein ComEC
MGVTRSAPFVILLSAIAIGIWLSEQFTIPIWLVLMVAGLAAVCVYLAMRGHMRDGAWSAVFVLLIAVGVLRAVLNKPDDSALLRLSGQRVMLEGVIVAEPDVRPTHTNVRVRILRLVARTTSHANLAGSVLVRAPKDMTWRYGDGIRVEGTLGTPPRFTTFDYRDYLARRGVRVWLPRPDRLWKLSEGNGDAWFGILLAAKDTVRQTVRHMMPAPESALLNGVLIGDDNDIPESLTEAFRRTGTSHIVAISGFNVSIVIALVVGLLSRIANRRRAALIVLPAIWVYAIFVGGSASVIRATGMATISLVGMLLWRRGFTLNTLCAAACFMLLADPNTLFDLGFQLSFLATLGLVLYADVVSSPAQIWLIARVQQPWVLRAVRLALDGVLMTFAAQLTTLPLIVATTEQLSLVSLLTNAIVLPLQPPLMLLGIIGATIAVFLPGVATLAGWPSYLFLTLTIRAVAWMGSWSFASVQVGWFGAAAATAYYCALASLTLIHTLPTAFRAHVWRETRRRIFSVATTLAGIVLALGGIVYLFQRPDGRLHVAFRGGSALIQTPQGQQILFLNGGHITPMLEASLPVWDRQIEWLILPNSDAYAVENLPAVEGRYGVGTLMIPRTLSGTLQSKAITLTRVISTQMQLEPGVSLSIRGDGTGRLHAQVTYADSAMVMLPTCTLTLMPAGKRADLAFIDPHLCSGQQLADAQREYKQTSQSRWLIWADTDAPALPQHDSVRTTRIIWLAETGQLRFVSDGARLVIHTP